VLAVLANATAIAWQGRRSEAITNKPDDQRGLRRVYIYLSLEEKEKKKKDRWLNLLNDGILYFHQQTLIIAIRRVMTLCPGM
jgi:hypothetical protein